MVSVEQLQRTMTSLLGDAVPRDFPFGKVSQMLCAYEAEYGLTLSAYGYVRWAIDHYGYKCLFKNLMASDKVVGDYAKEALKYMEDMPLMLNNAIMYANQLMANIADQAVCMKQLEGMTFPYVLYTFFAAGGCREVVEVYRPQMEEQMLRYPSTLDKLPESFKAVGREILNADAEQ